MADSTTTDRPSTPHSGPAASGQAARTSRIGRSLYRVFGVPYTPAHADRGVAVLMWKIIRKFFNVVVIPNIPFNPLRVWLYRHLVGFKIGAGAEVGMQTYLDDVHPERTIIEDCVTISYRCTFAVHGPGTSDTDRMILRRGCYLGVACTVVGNVEIGECATVGAGSLVIHDIPPYCTAVGVPARVIKTDTVPFDWSRAAVEASKRRATAKTPIDPPRRQARQGKE